MKATIRISTSFKGSRGSCSRFPGVARLDDGTLVVLYDDGESVDSVNHAMRIAVSRDNGRGWEDGGVMYDAASLDLAHPFTENCKPTAIGDNELVSVGFGFERDEPSLGLAAYAEKHGHFPAGHNTFSHSADGGRTWSRPVFIHHPHTVLELSGPALWCAAEKTLLAFGPPFVLKGERQRGICLASVDGGRTWQERGTFFQSATIAPWEGRSCRTADGRIWLVLWAYDLAKEEHLTNRLVFSDDLGATWSAPIDSGVRGQAANLFDYGGELHLLYTRREGDAPGTYCTPVGKACPPLCLWRSPAAASADGTIVQQFHNLKFGQPSMTQLDGGEWLLLFWSCEAPDGYAIRARVLALD